MCLGQIFLEIAIKDFNNKGYIFNQIAEVHIITIGKKMDMSYYF